MVDFKVVISNKAGKSAQKEIGDPNSRNLIGKKIGETIAGESIGLSGFEFQITGGSDHCGFPMRRDVQGMGRKRIFAVAGIGIKKKGKGVNNIHFLGYKTGDELNNEVRKSMFVVLPSEWYENYPRAIIEGFVLGKPAVGARIGGIPELVKDGETGLTFESGNMEDLKSKIIQLSKNPEGIIRMGKNARKKAEKYNPKPIIRLYKFPFVAFFLFR